MLLYGDVYYGTAYGLWRYYMCCCSAFLWASMPLQMLFHFFRYMFCIYAIYIFSCYGGLYAMAFEGC